METLHSCKDVVVLDLTVVAFGRLHEGTFILGRQNQRKFGEVAYYADLGVSIIITRQM